MNREQWLQSALTELRPIFETVGFPLPEKIRVTCGFPSSRAKANNRFLGEHWSPRASTDQHHEILISPVLDDAIKVFSTLVHELAHAATDGDGHGARFKRCARSLWLEGKPTSTYAGDTFKQNFAALIEGIGAYPHAALNIEAVRKKQATRMLKAQCPGCGFTVRLTQLWADRGLPVCSNDQQQFVLR